MITIILLPHCQETSNGGFHQDGRYERPSERIAANHSSQDPRPYDGCWHLDGEERVEDGRPLGEAVDKVRDGFITVATETVHRVVRAVMVVDGSCEPLTLKNIKSIIVTAITVKCSDIGHSYIKSVQIEDHPASKVSFA